MTEDINYDDYELAPGVVIRNLDLDGLTPQQQRAARTKADIANEEGETVYEIFTDVNPEFRIEPNIDFNLKEMTPDQREIYEALNELDDGVFEELEDDFVLVANEGVLPLRKKEEVVKEIIKATEVEELTGDQIKMQSFMDIIRKDAVMLGVTDAKKPEADDDDDMDEIDEEHEDDDYDEIKEEKSRKQSGVTPSNDADMEQPADILELMALNKPVKKGMEIVEQRVETIAGGGKLIFRKVKKAKKVDNDQLTDINPESEIGHQLGSEDIPQGEPDELDDAKLDQLSFEVDSDGEGVTKSELDRLEANYQRLKALKKQKKPGKDHSDAEDMNSEDGGEAELEMITIDGEELIKIKKNHKRAVRVKYNVKEDLILQNAIANDSDEELKGIERPLMKKMNAEICPLAPEDRIKPQNYYCMAVVKEDLDVKRKFISL